MPIGWIIPVLSIADMLLARLERRCHGRARVPLERVMHIERSARCMDGEMRRHPGERRDPDPGGRLDSRVRGNDH